MIAMILAVPLIWWTPQQHRGTPHDKPRYCASTEYLVRMTGLPPCGRLWIRQGKDHAD